MATTAGMNGFGRFGLHLLKYWLDRSHQALFCIKYINDDTLTARDAYRIITTDTAVRFDKYTVTLLDSVFIFRRLDGAKVSIEYTHAQKDAISWLGKPHLFFECSGKNSVVQECKVFLQGHTRLVLISCTSWDAEKTLIFGYNHVEFDPGARIISYGSCMVNAYVPLAAHLHEKYGVMESDANFIHNIQCYKRAAFNTLNRKLCTLERSGPRLLSFLNGNNFTVNYTVVPHIGVSMFDFRFRLKKAATKESIIQELNDAFSNGMLKNLYTMVDTDNGPEAYNCTTYSAVIIKDKLKLLADNLYLFGYFDNENSVNRYYDLVDYISSH